MKKLTTNGFIEKAEQVHGKRYDYSHTAYINTDTPVVIRCRRHGLFRQRPCNHLAGKHCKQCATEEQALKAALTTEEFVARARIKHGDHFDYSKAVYKNSGTPVTIVCKLHHTSFSQIAYNHLIGKIGCTECRANYHPPGEEIIRRFRAIHTEYGHNYDYDLCTFRNNKARLYITCRLHGPFSVSYLWHRKGTGCPECTNKFHSTAAKVFVRRARAVHGKTYAYGTYFGATNKMRITCPIHGEFYQTPASHLQGHGCPQHANDRKKLRAKGGYSVEFFVLHPEMAQHPGTFYLVEFNRDRESFVKVGITRTSIISRFKGGYNKYSWRLVATRSLSLYDAYCLEQKILEAFKKCQVFPKQDSFVGKTECLLSSCVSEVESWLQEHDTEATLSSSIPSVLKEGIPPTIALTEFRIVLPPPSVRPPENQNSVSHFNSS